MMRQAFRYTVTIILMMAVLTAKGYQVSVVSSIANGTISVSSSSTATAGTTVTITVTPENGYYITANDITITPTGTGSQAQTRTDPDIAATFHPSASSINAEGKGSYTFEMPESDVKIEANFTARTTITGATVKLSATTFTYNGSLQQPTVTSVEKDGTTFLTEESTNGYADYDVDIPNSINVKESPYVVTVTFRGKYTGTATADYAINKKDIIISGITAKDKDYDGTTTATLDYSQVVYEGIVEGDVLTVTATGNFEDANAGENKEVVISGLTLGGKSVANYQLATSGQQTSTTASIKPKAEENPDPQEQTDPQEQEDPQEQTDDHQEQTDDPQEQPDDPQEQTDDPQEQPDDPQEQADDPQEQPGDPQEQTDPQEPTSSIVDIKDENGNTYKVKPVIDESGTSSTNNEVIITELPASVLDGETSIPSTLNNEGKEYTITLIEAEAFKNKPEGTIIVLPEGVMTTAPVDNVVNGDGTCSKLVLSKVLLFTPTIKKIIAASVDFQRTVTAGLFPICLPFDRTLPTGVKAYSYAGQDNNGNAEFEEIMGTALKAGYPYMMKVTTASTRTRGTSTVDFGTTSTTQINLDVTDLKTTKDGLEFAGTIHGLTNAQGLTTGAYLLQADGQWKMTASDNAADANKIYIPAFQSYLIQTSGLTTSTIGNSIKSDEGSDPTAIQAIHTKDTDGTERWYNLNGIQIKNPTRKGIYIINGRKVIAK